MFGWLCTFKSIDARVKTKKKNPMYLSPFVSVLQKGAEAIQEKMKLKKMDETENATQRVGVR